MRVDNVNFKKILATSIAPIIMLAGIGVKLLSNKDKDNSTVEASYEDTIEEPTSSVIDDSIIISNEELNSINTNETYAYYEGGYNINGDLMCMLNISFKFDEDGLLVGDYSTNLTELKATLQAPMGIIVKLQDYSLADAYLALDEVKKIMSQYIVNFPIFYDVDSILKQKKYEGDPYAYENNYKMMVAFLEKAEYNGMFVGLAGTKEVIDSYKQTFIENGKEKLYSNTDILVYSDTCDYEDCHMIKYDGKYYTSKDYDRIIKQYNYNLASNFEDDYIYVVKPGDSMSLIQDMFDISNIENLYRCNYNYFEESRRLYPNQEIKIPTLLKEGRSDDNENTNVDKGTVPLDVEYVKGIDVSVNNSIDWAKLAQSEQVDFAIMRLCNTYYTVEQNNSNGIDARVYEHYNGCKENNIPMTYYIYCQWHSDHTEQEMLDYARKEAKFYVNFIKENNMEPDLNVLFFDYEGTKTDGQFQTPLCKGEMIEKIMNVHKEVVEEAGYTYGCYSNQGTMKKINMSNIKDTVYWIAGGSVYGDVYNIQDIIKPTSLNKISLDYSSNPNEEGVVIQQITSSGKIFGSNNNTDLNLMPKEWLEYLIELQKNNNLVR